MTGDAAGLAGPRHVLSISLREKYGLNGVSSLAKKGQPR